MCTGSELDMEEGPGPSGRKRASRIVTHGDRSRQRGGLKRHAEGAAATSEGGSLGARPDPGKPERHPRGRAHSREDSAGQGQLAGLARRWGRAERRRKDSGCGHEGSRAGLQ